MKNEVEKNFDCEKFKEKCIEAFNKNRSKKNQIKSEEMQKELEYFKKEFPSIININDNFEEEPNFYYEICGYSFFSKKFINEVEGHKYFLDPCESFHSYVRPKVYDQKTFGEYILWRQNKLEEIENQAPKYKKFFKKIISIFKS